MCNDKFRILKVALKTQDFEIPFILVKNSIYFLSIAIWLLLYRIIYLSYDTQLYEVWTLFHRIVPRLQVPAWPQTERSVELSGIAHLTEMHCCSTRRLWSDEGSDTYMSSPVDEYICVSKRGLLWHQDIIWIHAGSLLTGTMVTNFD